MHRPLSHPFSLSLILLLLLSGCASMNKDQCLVADWYQVGYEDGLRGENPARIRDYREDCASHGVAPLWQDYQQGHDAGSTRYCTPLRGFNHGLNGNQYNQNCPANLEASFLSAHRDGQTLFVERRHVNDLATQLDHHIHQLDDISEELTLLEDQLIADGLTRQQRLKIREQIHALEEQFDILALDLPHLELAVEQAEGNYQQRFDALAQKYHASPANE